MKTRYTMMRALVAFSVGLFSSPVLAGDLDAFRKCIDLENDIARLECFDAAAARFTNAELSSVGASGAGNEEQEHLPTPSRTPERLDPSEIKDADEAMVEGCEYLGIVVGKSGWGGLAAGAASKGTMRSAKKKAAAMGATHIVFGNFDNSSGMKASTRQARAYRCPGSADRMQPTSDPVDGRG